MPPLSLAALASANTAARGPPAVMQGRITCPRLADDPPDVMISPRLGRRITLFDLYRAGDAIAIGADAAEKAIEEISESIAARCWRPVTR